VSTGNHSGIDMELKTEIGRGSQGPMGVILQPVQMASDVLSRPPESCSPEKLRSLHSTEIHARSMVSGSQTGSGRIVWSRRIRL